jgi:acyl dehydratase
MPVKESAKGKTYPPHVYEVGLEKIREYAGAVGEDNPVYFDRERAKEAGFRDLVAPPMFAVVYSWKAVWAPAFDDEVGMDVAKLLHGEQEFVWAEPVCAGDVITTELSVADIYKKGPNGFYVFETVSKNQDGQETVRGTWTNIVRGAAEE